MTFPSNLDICGCLLRAVQKGMPTVQYRSAGNGRCTAVGEPENAMKRRKALVSKSHVYYKVRKVSKKASETREQTLHTQEQNR